MNEPHPRIDANPSDDEDRELRAVAALLRGLRDPEPPADLVERVMARVAEREAQPRLLRLFREIPERAVATAMAAGIGCLLLFGAVRGGLLEAGPVELATRSEVAPEQPLQTMRARLVTSETAAETDAARSSRPFAPPFGSAAVIDAQPVGLTRPQLAYGALAPSAARLTDPLDALLDHQLNHLLLDPAAFYQRLDRIADRERFVARLADRAARRGDAAEVALRLRQHPQQDPRHTSMLVDRLLRAALARTVAER